MSITRIGLISDTHGLLRNEAKAKLQGCDLILHAGDIDEIQILEELKEIAPTTAVRGNMDLGRWTGKLKIVERLQIGSWSITLVHNLDHLDLEQEQADIIVFGHSHRFLAEKRGDTLLFNPGSAGPRRFQLPITMAILTLEDSDYTLEKIVLKDKT